MELYGRNFDAISKLDYNFLRIAFTAHVGIARLVIYRICNCGRVDFYFTARRIERYVRRNCIKRFIGIDSVCNVFARNNLLRAVVFDDRGKFERNVILRHGNNRRFLAARFGYRNAIIVRQIQRVRVGFNLDSSVNGRYIAVF